MPAREVAHVAVEQPENLIRVRAHVADQITDHEGAAFEAIDLRRPHPVHLCTGFRVAPASRRHPSKPYIYFGDDGSPAAHFPGLGRDSRGYMLRLNSTRRRVGLGGGARIANRVDCATLVARSAGTVRRY